MPNPLPGPGSTPPPRLAAMTGLVLSLFPGIGLLDMAFEEEGFTVVRGPDLLWGGDIRRFHVPAGKFDGVIGGPPCQAFSRMRHINPRCGNGVGNLIPEFERVVAEAAPRWFIMENVPEAPTPHIPGYSVCTTPIRDVWVGGDTNRLRHFSFGTREGVALPVNFLALHRTDPEPAVLAGGGGRRVPVAIGGSGKIKASRRVRAGDQKTAAGFSTALRGQGLPSDFDLPPFTVAAKVKAIGNGVPLPMGRAVAKAVVRALCESPTPEATAHE